VKSGGIRSLLKAEIDKVRPTGPLLTVILSTGQRAGFHRLDLWDAIISSFRDTASQKLWANWTDLDDREEIRLRLKVLIQTERVDESLNDFVTFFFRASDPVLYQLSAVILGREINRQADLKKYFENYTGKRGVKPNEPVKLNGQRSRRRILLARCASVAFSDKSSKTESPVFEQPFKDLTDSDLSIIFSSISLLIEHGAGEGHIEYVSKLVKLRFETDRLIRDRNLIRNTGILLERLQKAEQPIGDLFNLSFNKSLNQYNQAKSLASRLQALFLMDELMESSVHIGLSFSGSGEGDNPGGRFNRFLKCRWIYWAYMHRKNVNPGEEKLTGEEHSIVDQVYRVAPHENTQRQYQIFAGEIHLLNDLSKWRTLTLEERAYRAFFLVDFSLHPEVFDSEELYLLLDSNGYLDKGSFVEKEGEIRNPLSPVLKRLIEAEPSVSRELFDPQLIHRLDSPELLPILIPTSVNSELLPVLADAVEHQIRFQLATDPAFNPGHFLYLITVRHPVPAFYHFLAELSSGREYRNSQNGLYLLNEIAVKLANDKQSKGNDTDPFWNILSGLREDLEKLSTSKDPFYLLNAIIHELKSTGAESAREGITLYDLLNIVQPNTGSWYRRGVPSTTTQTGRAITERIAWIVVRIEEKAKNIKPKILGNTFAVSEALQGIEHHLGTLREEILPLLGAAESELFNNALEGCISLLQEWEKVYLEASVMVRFRDKADYTEALVSLLNMIIQLENSIIQKELLENLLETLLSRSNATTDKGWLARYEVLDWASGCKDIHLAGTEAQQVWYSRLEALWVELAEAAMSRNAEARVVQLVRNKSLSKIRNGEKGREVLQEIKKWCFNRYDFYNAHQCNSEMGGSQMGTSILRTFKEYAGHYASVWLALFVGVIFMFDFGDPWTELAEMGDVGGVLFTFFFGVAGTFLYVWSDLRKNTVYLTGDPFRWVSVFGRVSMFLIVTLLYTFLVVSLFWYMFSSTEQVVHGANTPLHLLSWTGFALFVGVFFGLLGQGD
jgi:hypothetical protein